MVLRTSRSTWSSPMLTTMGTWFPPLSVTEKQVILLSFTCRLTTFLVKSSLMEVSAATLAAPSATLLALRARGSAFPAPSTAPAVVHSRSRTANRPVR